MYLEVNNIKLFYKKKGTKEPLILLHGNGESHEIFSLLIDKLSLDYTVYAIDTRCHGASGSTKELTYDLMAEDIYQFIIKSSLNKPFIYGFSDGGIVALLLSIKYPNLFDKIIVSGININPKGLSFIWRFIFSAIYLFKRDNKIRLMLKEPNITLDELNNIKSEVVILAGEKDVIKKNHTMVISKNIRNSTLKIIPKENHSSYVFDNEKLYNIIKEYLI